MLLPPHLRSRRVLLGFSLALMVFLTAGFTGSRAPAPHQPVPASVHVTKLTVTATETASAYTLAPAALTVPAGQPVELTLINKGASIHNWAAPDLAATGLQVLSMPKDLPADTLRSAVSAANSELHTIVDGHPDRFAAFAALPCATPDAAAAELERTVTQLGFVGAMTFGIRTRGPTFVSGLRSSGISCGTSTSSRSRVGRRS